MSIFIKSMMLYNFVVEPFVVIPIVFEIRNLSPDFTARDAAMFPIVLRILVLLYLDATLMPVANSVRQ